MTESEAWQALADAEAEYQRVYTATAQALGVLEVQAVAVQRAVAAEAAKRLEAARAVDKARAALILARLSEKQVAVLRSCGAAPLKAHKSYAWAVELLRWVQIDGVAHYTLSPLGKRVLALAGEGA